MRRGARSGPIERVCAALLFCGLISGCRSPQEKLDESRRSLASWAATLASVSGLWSEDHAPDAYARQTSKSADEQIRKELRKIEKEKSDPSGKKEKLRDAALQLAGSARALTDAVRRSDREAARRFSAAASQMAHSLSAGAP